MSVRPLSQDDSHSLKLASVLLSLPHCGLFSALHPEGSC